MQGARCALAEQKSLRWHTQGHFCRPLTLSLVTRNFTQKHTGKVQTGTWAGRCEPAHVRVSRGFRACPLGVGPGSCSGSLLRVMVHTGVLAMAVTRAAGAGDVVRKSARKCPLSLWLRLLRVDLPAPRLPLTGRSRCQRSRARPDARSGAARVCVSVRGCYCSRSPPAV